MSLFSRARRDCFNAPFAARRLPPLVCALLFTLCALSASAQTALVPWWDTTYTHRQRFTAVPNDYQVFLSFDHATLVAGGNSQVDGDDVRVVQWDGTANTEIARLLVPGSSWNNAATRIVFRSQASIGAPGLDTDYFLYYGNASAANPPIAVPITRYVMAESLPEQTRVNMDTFGQVATMTFTPSSAAEVWLYFATFAVRSSEAQGASDSTLEARTVLNGVEDITVEQQNNEPNRYKQMIIAGRVTGATTPQTLRVDIKSLQATTTTSVKNIRIVAALLPPTADFRYAGNDAAQVLQSNWGDVANPQLSFSPSSAGDYYIIAAGQHHEEINGAASSHLRFTIDNGTTFWPAPNTMAISDDGTPINPPTTEYSTNPRGAWDTFFAMRKVALTAGAKTFKFQFQSSSDGADDSGVKGLRIIAFRADAFASAEGVENTPETTTASLTPIVKSTLTTAAPPAPRDYLAVQSQYLYDLGPFAVDNTHQELADFRRGATVLADQDHTLDNPRYTMASGVAHALTTASAQTYENRFWTNNTVATHSKESAIHVLGWRESSTTLSGCEETQTGGSNSLNVSPAGGLTSSGPHGGPYAPASIAYTVSNASSISINWTAAAGQPWVTVAPTSGTLAPGASAIVTVSIDNTNPAASCLGAGSYSDTVTFTNTTNACGTTTRPVSLTVTGAVSGPMSVSPAGGLASTGNVGGPFSPTSITYTVTNSGAASMCWTARALQTWVTLSQAGGELAPGASTTVVVSIGASAAGLGPGAYADTVIFSNTSGGSGSTTRPVSLSVSAPPGTTTQMTVTPTAALSSSGRVGGPFIPAAISYTVTNTGTTSLTWSASSTQAWVTLSTTGGPLAAGASATLTVSINGAADALAAGVYADTVTIANATNGSGNTLRSVSLLVSTDFPPTVTITTPATSPSSTTATPAQVSGTAADNVTVTGITWANAATGSSGSASGTTAWSAQIPLTPGNNFITVTAFDNMGNTGNASVIVIYTPIIPPPPPPPREENPVWGGCWASTAASPAPSPLLVLALALALVHVFVRGRGRSA